MPDSAADPEWSSVSRYGEAESIIDASFFRELIGGKEGCIVYLCAEKMMAVWSMNL